jgi:hypothetical protein
MNLGINWTNLLTMILGVFIWEIFLRDFFIGDKKK